MDWMISLNNGLLDVTTRKLLKPSPRWFCTSKLRFDYNPTKECLGWMRWLHDTLENDPQRISLIQEFFGYVLTPEAGAQKMMWFLGEGGTGKSTCGQVLTQLIGRENVSTVSLESWERNFAMAPMLGKMLNIADEVGTLTTKVQLALKWYLGGTPMTIDRKYEQPVQLTPSARLLCISNHWPRFADRSEGIWRRVIVCPFDRMLDQKNMRPEFWREICTPDGLSGLLNWALEGRDRLYANNLQFTRSDLGEEMLEVRKEVVHSHKEWIKEHIVVGGDDDFIPTKILAAKYREWCEKVGGTHMNDNDLQEAVRRELKVKNGRRSYEGVRARGLQGVKFCG